MAYDNPAGLVAGSVIMQVISALCVGLRIFSRRWQKQSLIVSDWLILVAFVFGLGLTVMEIYGVSVEALGHPLGATIEDPTAVTGRLNKAKHIELSFLMLGILTLGFIKLSVCFLYWHLFSRMMFRRFLVAWMVVIVIWTASFIIAGLAECGSHLLALFGTPQEYLDHCGSAIGSGYANVGTDILTDVVTLVIPIPIVMKLQMPTSKRILVMLTFLIGALSVGASIAKAYIYIEASLGRYTDDAITILTGLSIWNLAEVQIGIIAACGPTLRSILGHVLSTESIKSLLRSSSWQSKSKLSGQPGFSQMPESVEQFAAAKRRDGSQASSDRDTFNQYEMEPRRDAPPTSNAV